MRLAHAHIIHTYIIQFAQLIQGITRLTTQWPQIAN